MASVNARRESFAALHERGCFVIPNPWDAGSARILEHLGFKALASTSAGLAFTKGLPDTMTALSRDAVLEHLRELVLASELPVNADFQSGYAEDPDGVAANVRLCVATGVAGVSIEDATGDEARPLYPLAEAVRRIEAARAAIDASGERVLLTARAEAFLVGEKEPLADVLKRLVAYSKAGADVLYAPGARTEGDLRAIVSAVSPKPVNALVSTSNGMSVEELARLGVRRVSVGSALARVAWGGFLRAAKALSRGSFEGLEGAASFSELNGIFNRG